VNWSFVIVVPTIFSPWFHFPDKLKYLSSADHFTCSTSILIYLQVLPHVISRKWCHCTTSCEFFLEWYSITSFLAWSVISLSNFNYATWSLFPEHNFDNELSLRRSSSSYHFILNSKVNSEIVSCPWFRWPLASPPLLPDVVADRLHIHETYRQNVS
jgi:hypothetical protein